MGWWSKTRPEDDLQAKVAAMEVTLQAVAQTVAAQVQVTQPESVVVETTKKVLHWLTFTVCFGLLPLFCAWAISEFRGTGRGLTDLLGKGELLMISAVIAGAAIGEVFSASRELGQKRPASIGKVFLYYLGAVAIFSALIGNLIVFVALLPEVPEFTVSNWSIVLFLLTAASSCLIIGMVERV
jgi:hypothetical protein